MAGDLVRRLTGKLPSEVFKFLSKEKFLLDEMINATLMSVW